MNNLLTKLKRSFRKLLHYFPTPLPVGMTEFHAWCDDIIFTYDLPDNESVRWMLAAVILSVSEYKGKSGRPHPIFYTPKRYFGLTGLKASSNEIANGYMQELKAKQKAQIEAAKSKQLAEATANLSVVASDGQQPKQS